MQVSSVHEEFDPLRYHRTWCPWVFTGGSSLCFGGACSVFGFTRVVCVCLTLAHGGQSSCVCVSVQLGVQTSHQTVDKCLYLIMDFCLVPTHLRKTPLPAH